jgi:hypothetical protein
MQAHERPSIAQLSARLAANNARVIEFLDSLTGRIDTLVEAASAGDWQEVERLSDYLSRAGAAYGYPLISQAAERLCDAITSDDETLMKRCLVKLIGVCGRARRPDESAGQ